MPTRDQKAYQFLRDDLVAAGDLAALVGRYAEAEGANQHVWPGLTFYRFSRPVPAHWDEVEVEIIEASPHRPFLSFVLQIESAIVSDVLSAMHQP
jgi:hypothetical protein